MSNYQIPRRLQSIIHFINDREYASKEELMDYLKEKDLPVSLRTLERDFGIIRSDFGIELIYDKARNGYCIDKEKSVRVDSFFKFLELVTIADVFRDGLKDSRKIFDYVSFDDSSHLRGIENLEIILLAIKQGKRIEFTHANYHRNTEKPYTITPLMLKEYINRWYVVGVPSNLNEIRTFGIDRMTDLKLGSVLKLDKKKYKKQLSQFDNIIGLNYSAEKPIDIVLKVNNFHIKYLESLPLHKSQKIESLTGKDYSLVNYKLIPNYEFEIQVLKMSLEAEVIEPLHYRNHIKSRIEAIYNKYNNQ